MPPLSTGQWSVTLDGYLHGSVRFVKSGPPPLCGSVMVLQNLFKGVGSITFSGRSVQQLAAAVIVVRGLARRTSAPLRATYTRG